MNKLTPEVHSDSCLCPACHGTGHVTVDVIKECSICEGTGTVLGRPCPKCQGSAPTFLTGEDRVCLECAGVGLL